MLRTQITISEQLAKDLRTKSENTGVSIAEIIRRATILYLEQEPKEQAIDTGIKRGGRREPRNQSPERAAS